MDEGVLDEVASLDVGVDEATGLKNNNNQLNSTITLHLCDEYFSAIHCVQNSVRRLAAIPKVVKRKIMLSVQAVRKLVAAEKYS